MKVILSILDQTKSVIDKLESNVGGIELLGSRTASDLKKVMLSAGKVNKKVSSSLTYCLFFRLSVPDYGHSAVLDVVVAETLGVKLE